MTFDPFEHDPFGDALGRTRPEPAALDGELFERIDRLLEGRERARHVFAALADGLSFLPEHAQLMHLYGTYDDLQHGEAQLTERDVQRGLQDAIPHLFTQVLHYGQRPVLETYDPTDLV